MNYRRMEEISEALFDRYRELRETKGREYAGEEDTLADFKEVAAEVGVTPLQCWAIYVKKHERARDTFIREGGVKSESIDSRIDDIVTYHALLLGLVEDELIEREAADRRAVLDERAIRIAEHDGGERVHVIDPPPSGGYAPVIPSPWDILRSHIGKTIDEEELFAIRHELEMHGHRGQVHYDLGFLSYTLANDRVSVQVHE